MSSDLAAVPASCASDAAAQRRWAAATVFRVALGCTIALAVVLLLLGTPQPADAQLDPYDQCIFGCISDYEACLGSSWPGLVKISFCLGDLGACVDSCTPDSIPFPGPIAGGGGSSAGGGGGGGGGSGGGAGGGGGGGGDPIDSGSGTYQYSSVDLTLPDVIPIDLVRTYRQEDSVSRAFGVGMTHNYDLTIYFDHSPQHAYADLVLPDAGQIHFTRISSGSGYIDAVLQHTSTPTQYYGSSIDWNGSGWTLSLANGTQMTFGSGAILTSIQDPNGNTLSIQRDSSNNVQAIVSPHGRTLNFTYDGNHRVTQVQDNTGRAVSYAYDANGHLSTFTDVTGDVTTYAYDSLGALSTITAPNAQTPLNNQYDSNGRISVQTLADGSTWQYAYTTDANGNTTAADINDPRGYTRHVTFDSNGYVASETHAAGQPEQQTISYQRDPNTHFVLSASDQLGRQNAYTYDSMGHVTGLTTLAGTPQAVTTTISYDPVLNLPTSISDSLGRTYSMSYDDNGHPISMTDAMNNVTTFTYNAQGQMIGLTDPNGVTESFGYDPSGAQVTASDALGNTVTNLLDIAGRVVGRVDPFGNQSSTTYDEMNHPLQTIDALGDAEQYAYDSLGNIQSITDPLGGVSTFGYDNRNRPSSIQDPLNRIASYAYDASGNPASVTDKRGQVTVYAYDGLNRVTFAGFGANGGTYESTISYTYDSADRTTQLVDSAAGTITRTYDNSDNLTSETTPQGSITYTYNSMGRRASMTVAGQPPVTYAYDGNNRLLTMSQANATVSFAYDGGGRLTAMTLPNGIVGAYGYDGASRQNSRTYTLNGNTLGSLAYTYDSLSRIVSVSGSLARVALPNPAANTYDLANQFNAFGSSTFQYDNNGNLTSDGVNTYTWSARNQLVAINGAVTASFIYDAEGRRVSKSINGVTTQYLYDGQNVVQELQGGSPSANLLTIGTDQYFMRTDSTGSYVFLTDALGSTIALTDLTGAIQTTYTYDPFGNVTIGGASNANPYQFTGRENDRTGLYYYRARYYSPALQRFISPDPAETEPSYVYAGNDPVMYGDPSGDYALTPIPPDYLIFEVGNVVYNETSTLFGPQPNLSFGRTDLASALFNGSELFGKNLCQTGYIQAPFTCAPPDLTILSPIGASIYQDSVEAAAFAAFGLFSSPQENLGGIQYYSIGKGLISPGAPRADTPQHTVPDDTNDREYLVFQDGPFNSGLHHFVSDDYFSFWSNTCYEYMKYDGTGYYPQPCQGKKP